jgi:NAD+ synthase (glutamine-hydrolysing)
VNATLLDILDTKISPVLIPASAQGEMQSTEDKVRPYELHDFTIYYLTRYGLRPSKTAYLAYEASHDVCQGSWPPGLPDAQRRSYSREQIRHWLEVFLYRFFAIRPFKRTAMANGLKGDHRRIALASGRLACAFGRQRTALAERASPECADKRGFITSSCGFHQLA